MNLYCGNITNDISFTTKCDEQASIRDLKEILSLKLKTYPCLFHLVYNGRTVDGEETLQHANVKNESKLYFMMKLMVIHLQLSYYHNQIVLNSIYLVMPIVILQ